MFRLLVCIGRRWDVTAQDDQVAALARYAVAHHPGKAARVVDGDGVVVLRMTWPERNG